MVGAQSMGLVPAPWCDGPLPRPGGSGQLSGVDREDGDLGPSFTTGLCTQRVQAKPTHLVCDVGHSGFGGRATLDPVPTLGGGRGAGRAAWGPRGVSGR